MFIHRMDVVQEAYFGKSKNLMEAERLIGQIRKKMIAKTIAQKAKRTIDALAINKSKENLALQKVLEAEFGFGEMVIHWDGAPVANAFSADRGILLILTDSFPKLPVNQNGRYYDSDHGYMCVVNLYAGLFDEGLTDEEIMAVLLHEIGHNFQCTPMVNLCSLTDWVWGPLRIVAGIHMGAPSKNFLIDIYRYVAGLSEVMAGFSDIVLMFIRQHLSEELKAELDEADEWISEHKEKYRKMWEKILKNVEKNNQILKRRKDVYLSGPILNLLWNLLTKALTFALCGPYTAVSWAEEFYNAQTGYSGEVFADSFASTYGYGAATVSLHKKFENMNYKSQFTAAENSHCVANQYIILMMYMMQMICDCHPTSQTRMKNQINKLKRELNSGDVPDSLKVKVAKDLQNAEAIYNQYLQMDESQKHLVAIHAFRNLNERWFGGKLEFRDIINRIVNVGMTEA